MRKPDKTLIFGTPQTGPLSQRAPVSMGAPVSRPLEKQWFNEPPPPPSFTQGLTPLDPSQPVSELRRPVGDDLLAERRGFIPKSPERGLAFAAVALALIGVAGAGTYFFFGLENTAHREETTSTTTVTNAEMPTTETPAATAPAPTPAPAAEPADLPWTPPVVDAVKSPNLQKEMATAPQMAPTERPATTPVTAVAKPVAAPKPPKANNQQTAEGYYPNYAPQPGDTSVTPPAPQPTPPSAADTDVTTHMTPEENDNTVRNPAGEPALPQTIHQ